MQYERKVQEIGGSNMLVLPIDLCKFLELKTDDIVIIQDDQGKHGNFISIWKKKV